MPDSATIRIRPEIYKNVGFNLCPVFSELPLVSYNEPTLEKFYLCVILVIYT